jgi:IS30 family transposase
MSISKYQKNKIEKDKKEALMLYKRGFSLRKIAALLNRSHQWVWLAIKAVDKKA